MGTVNPASGWLDILQDVAQLAGTVDPTGVVDLTNSLVYALRGKWELASVSLVGVLPYVGDLAKAGRAARWAVAKEVASEASEQLAKRTARELPPVVIGENMKDRVVPYALRHGYQTIEDFVPARLWQEAFAQGKEAALALNRRWIEQMMREGRRIIDIGPDFSRRWQLYLAGKHPASDFYELERKLLRDYPNYIKRFLRFGKWRGREF